MPNSSYLLEVCVDSMASAFAAQTGGAHRLELCASLAEGGLTPSAGMIELACQQLSIGSMVMIRPRGGDFLYSDAEFAIMQADIDMTKQFGAPGVVFGLLTAEGTIDRTRTAALIERARPMQVTFHRAFDMVADPHAALDTLIELGVDRLLTSGLERNPLLGAPLIAQLVQQAAGRIEIMPGGGVTHENIAAIAQQTGVRELHMSGRAPEISTMRYRNERITLGNQDAPEYMHQVTSTARIRASLDALEALAQAS